MAKRHQSRDAISQPVDALRLGLHIKFFARRQVGSATEHHRTCRAIQFGDRHHHGRLDGHQTHGGRLPILQALKLETLNREVRHI